MTQKTYKSLLFGLAIGDALGLPVEFEEREKLKLNPVKDMIGYGTFDLPPGTFSDDSSLSFCLAEALIKDFDLKLISQYFVDWYKNNYWTYGGEVFDIGKNTEDAITKLDEGIEPLLAGGVDESSNGNGSLMRISPLVFYIKDKPISERFQITQQVSSITHAHIRSIIACFYYLEFARGLINKKDKFEIYKELQMEIPRFLESISISPSESNIFERLLRGNVYELKEEDIFSNGYVLHTLEASIWCLLTSQNYSDAVLKAVNLGEDSDTTAAVTGALAGLLYGIEDIPERWINQIARKDDIEDLAERFEKMFGV